MQQKNDQTQNRQIKIQVTEADYISCKCGNKYFDLTYRVARKASPIIGQTIVAPIQSFVCRSCGELCGDTNKN